MMVPVWLVYAMTFAVPLTVCAAPGLLHLFYTIAWCRGAAHGADEARAACSRAGHR
jgi:hypothetical protein